MIANGDLVRLLDELRHVARDPSSPAAVAALARLTDLGVPELLRIDALSRSWYSNDEVLKRPFARRGQLEIWLTSMVRNGWLREQMVDLLASDADPGAGRVLALRVDDPVTQVRDAAWRALAGHIAPEQAWSLVPVLVALSGRLRSADAVRDYARLYAAAHQDPLWRLLIDHPDRRTRRWAINTGISEAGFGSAEALLRLETEPDQAIAPRWVELLVRDRSQLPALLESRWAAARAAALEALGPELDADTLEAALLDKAARVRAAAQELASQRGIAPDRFYLDHWSTSHHPRSLLAAARLGAHLPQAELLGLLRDPDHRVRAAAATIIEPVGDAIPALFGLLNDPSSSVATTAMRALAGSDDWQYPRAAVRWASVDSTTRGRLLVLLQSRSGWDRVRGSLLGMGDPDLDVRGTALTSLFQWRDKQALRMYREPTTAQRADLLSLLAAAQDLPLQLRNDIEFRLNLPQTPPPWR